jgi:DNA (cytosine-5)-methyltransferase 1
VQGVLSSGGGRDFGAFLGALGELGYGWAYRVLDAQNFGVAQRRRRVFVVGHLGNWKPAAEVLFESESLSGDIKSSRKKKEETAKCPTTSIRNDCETKSVITHCVDTFPTLLSSTAGVSRTGNAVTEHETYIAYNIRECDSNNTFNAIETKTATTLQKTQPSVQSHHTQTFVTKSMAVRRLTPVECERLQGFPDGYTNIKEDCPDGSRYKALGNSMAVPVMRWIGERINQQK